MIPHTIDEHGNRIVHPGRYVIEQPIVVNDGETWEFKDGAVLICLADSAMTMRPGARGITITGAYVDFRLSSAHTSLLARWFSRISAAYHPYRRK